MDDAELVMHKPVDARQHGIEIVHQDLALCNNLTAAANVFLGRELRKGVGPFSILDYPSMYRRAGEIFKELKSETRPRDLVKQDVGRPAPGRGHRPHHAVGSQDRADGRADGGDLGAPGGRGAEPHPPSARHGASPWS